MTEKSIGKFSFSPFAIFSLLAAIILKLPKWISKLYITLKYLPRRWHKSGQDSTSEEREHAHIHPIKSFIHASTDTGSLCTNKSVENQEDKKKQNQERLQEPAGKAERQCHCSPGRAGLQDGSSQASLQISCCTEIGCLANEEDSKHEF